MSDNTSWRETNKHWSERKLDWALSGVWMGRHPVVEKATLKRLGFEFWTYEYGHLLWCAHYNYVCADNLFSWDQTPETGRGLSNRLNIIIVKLNFPPKNNALTVILNVFLILTDEKILFYYFYSHVLCNHRHNNNSACF